MTTQDRDEITRVWERQRLAVVERSPAIFQELRTAIDERRSTVHILNLIDIALDREPSAATITSAATMAFDHIRDLVTLPEREAFLRMLSEVNRQLAPPIALKQQLFRLASTHHATALLEGTYFDDVRLVTVDRGGYDRPRSAGAGA